jgi:hypothetical protein
MFYPINNPSYLMLSPYSDVPFVQSVTSYLNDPIHNIFCHALDWCWEKSTFLGNKSVIGIGFQKSINIGGKNQLD